MAKTTSPAEAIGEAILRRVDGDGLRLNYGGDGRATHRICPVCWRSERRGHFDGCALAQAIEQARPLW